MTGAVPPSLVAFGELLLRLDPSHGSRLAVANGFDARYTGAEANVAASLAGFGIATELVSVVPDTAIGQACMNYLRSFGVGTRQVQRRPGRLGILFHEMGGVGRPSTVLYDRAGSTFATCEPDAYDWRAILPGRSWLHLSGTAAALGATVSKALQAAASTAHELGLGVSLDLNYRASMWTLAQAGEALRPVLEHVRVLLGVGPDAATMFGLRPPSTAPTGQLALDEQLGLSAQLLELFRLDAVGGTRRTADHDAKVLLQGLFTTADGASVSRAYPVLDTVGRIGTGDAFAAGVLRGVMTGRTGQETVDFATAAAHLKQSIHGDINLVTVEEVDAVVAGTDSGRVRR
jgi:2-dehydro-3-deoxygluconokinase